MSMPPPLMLDACVLLNLLATDRINEILLSSQREVFISDLVQEESYYLKSLDGSDEKILIDLQPLIDNGIIKICNVENDVETALFVNLAAQLDDGEAKSIAISISRQFAIATDDKKARRIIRETGSGTILFSSLDLVREWVEAESIVTSEIEYILQRIQKMANYFPHAKDHNYKWWSSMIS